MVERNKTFQILANGIMVLLVIFCMLPLILLFSSSLNEEHALIVNGYSFLPSKLDFSAYKYILVDSTQLLRGYGIDLIAFYSLAASLLDTELFQISTLAHTVFRYYQEGISLAVQLHSHNFIPVVQVHSDNAHGHPSGRPYIGFLEPDTHTVLGHQEKIDQGIHSM